MPPSLNDYIEQTVAFKLHAWQRDFLNPRLEECLSKGGQRILIHAPPRFGKSIIVSQRFPAWLMGCDPLHRIGLACYNEKRATDFGEVIKALMLFPEYEEVFQGRAHIRKDAATGQFWTDERLLLRDGQPSFQAMGLNSGFVGRGVDTLIMDDPYKSADEAKSITINEKVYRFWSETAGVRLPEETNVVVMFHRYHEEDLAGKLIEEGGWDYIRFPAIADKNEDESDPTGREEGEILSPMRTREFLQKQEDKDLMVYLGQFQGVPRAAEGNIIKRGDLQICEPSEVPRISIWVRFWDLATKAEEQNDPTAGGLMGMDEQQNLYLWDMSHFRKEWADAQTIIDKVHSEDMMWIEHMKTGRGVEDAMLYVAVEKVAWQRSMWRDFVANATKHRLNALPIDPKKEGDKLQRSAMWRARARYGKFFMVRTGNWDIPGFIAECLSFTGGDIGHDDRVDAVSGASQYLYLLMGGSDKEPDPIPNDTPDYFKALLKKEHNGIDGYYESEYTETEDRFEY